MKNLSKKVTGYKLVAVCAALSGVMLTGCSSSSSSGSDDPDGAAAGLAFDGYLRNALVCVDENLNKECDDSEPQTTTGEGGEFELTGLTDEQLLLPLVMEATGDTIDEDDPTASVDTALKFLAPSGSETISGFSTIIQILVERKIAEARDAGETVPSLADLKAEASAELAAELGIPNADLTAFDPIAIKNNENASEAQRRAAAKAHLVNQVLSQQIITLRPLAESISMGSNNRAAFGAVISKLSVSDLRAAVEKDFPDTTGLPELINAIADQVVSETQPETPTAQEIQEQAEIDEEAAEEIVDQVGVEQEPTGGTGATGGTGGTGTS
ncbi:MAG: hypothetical protein ACQEV6_08300 [Pseudomonadota bacterium]